jgi:2-haloacid dehalogenase
VIAAVVFDLGNVLIGWDPRNLYRELIAEEAAREDFLIRVCNMAWNEQQDAGRTWAEAVAVLAGEFPEHRALIEAYDRDWHRMLSGPIAGSVRLLEDLKARGTPLFALTNWSSEKFPIARERYPFLQLFDGIVVSGDERMKKPDPRIFALLAERHGLTPGRTLFIDDSRANIDAARALGFVTHHFQGAEGLETALVELGLR